MVAFSKQAITRSLTATLLRCAADGHSSGYGPLLGTKETRRLRQLGAAYRGGARASAIMSAQASRITWPELKHTGAVEPMLALLQSEQNNEYFLHHRRSGRGHCGRRIFRAASLTNALASGLLPA